MVKNKLSIIIDQLRDQADIADVIGEYVSLQRRGRQLLGLCPFHNEKTPSFSVSREKKFFHCFGCKESGTVFDFVMKVEKVEFVEAVRLLCNKYNLAMPEVDDNPQVNLRDKKRKELLQINSLARNFFHNCLLQTSYGVMALAYLENRGINIEVIKEFSLGFAPDDWQKMTVAFRNRKIDLENLKELGLIDYSQRSENYYDRFRNRLIIPIFDSSGNAIAFGGRAIDDNPPKYLNSPESIIFDKSNTLFGLDKAKTYCREKKFVLVVEGYFDLLQIYSHGIKNVVASMGTAFTMKQARKALRLAERIIFNYDNDDAGLTAVVRAGQMIINCGGKAQVIITDDCKDPDEYIKKYGVDKYQEKLNDAFELYDFLIEQAKIKVKNGADKVQESRKLLVQVSAIQDELEVERVLDKISRELLVSAEALRAAVKKQRRSGRKKSTLKNVEVEENVVGMSAELTLERGFLQAIIIDKSLHERWLQDDIIEMFTTDFHKLLYDNISQHKDFDVEQLMLESDDKCSQALATIMSLPVATDNLALQAEDCYKKLKVARLRNLKAEHERRAMELEAKNNPSYVEELSRARRISMQIVELNKA